MVHRMVSLEMPYICANGAVISDPVAGAKRASVKTAIASYADFNAIRCLPKAPQEYRLPFVNSHLYDLEQDPPANFRQACKNFQHCGNTPSDRQSSRICTNRSMRSRITFLDTPMLSVKGDGSVINLHVSARASCVVADLPSIKK